jgi:Holliday junction resolvase-like predicted endonuclease
MIKVKAVSVREKEELEPLLVANPEIIEDGLKILTHQHPTDSGFLDILAVDSDATLVVIELKNEAADDHLDQGLRYYDWCRQNISWIANAYSSKAKINAEASPRLMLVAPAFTETVKRIAKYVDAELDLIEYHAFENEKRERGLICTAIDFGQAPVPPEIPSIEKKMEYFQSEKVKELFRSVLEELSGRQVEIKPIHDLWISFWYRRKRFMYMAPKRSFFVVEVLKSDGNWSGRIRVSTRKEWDQTLQRYVEKYIQYLDRSK